MSDYIGPILAAIPGLIAAFVAYLSKQAGKERRAATQSDHATLEAKLDTLSQNLTTAQQEAAAARAESFALQEKLTKAELKNDKLTAALSQFRNKV